MDISRTELKSLPDRLHFINHFINFVMVIGGQFLVSHARRLGISITTSAKAITTIKKQMQNNFSVIFWRFEPQKKILFEFIYITCLANDNFKAIWIKYTPP